MKTIETTVYLSHGALRIPSGLMVKPAQGIQTAPLTGLWVLDEFPEYLFPMDSTIREAAIDGHLFYLTERQVQK